MYVFILTWIDFFLDHVFTLYLKALRLTVPENETDPYFTQNQGIFSKFLHNFAGNLRKIYFCQFLKNTVFSQESDYLNRFLGKFCL